MKGHDAILKMRHGGRKPRSVWLFDDGGFTGGTPWERDTVDAQVEIAPTDNPQTLDLRFCAGLVVHVHAINRKRLDYLTANAIDCGAARVLGCLFDEYRRGSMNARLEMFDTDSDFVGAF